MKYMAFIFPVLMMSVSVISTPVIQQQYCPVVNNKGSEPIGSKVINMDAVEGRKVRLQFAYPNENVAKKMFQDSSAETTTILGDREVEGTTMPSFKQNIFCQWDFRTGNESQLLLLTFDKLSAPYSEDCSNAFVAMQKSNAFESRWCGNGKQTKAKPMTVFSRGSAKVSVYHNLHAAMSPPTGFAVTVETVDPSMIEGGKNKNALRVLLG